MGIVVQFPTRRALPIIARKRLHQIMRDDANGWRSLRVAACRTLIRRGDASDRAEARRMLRFLESAK